MAAKVRRTHERWTRSVTGHVTRSVPSGWGIALTLCLGWAVVVGAEPGEGVWPALPDRDSVVTLPAQEWAYRPGPRQIRVSVYYPEGRRSAVGRRTGIFLTLHNWGGTDCVGTADPRVLAEEFQTIGVCVNYLQSGKAEGVDGPEPYDFGWLQALDALRALWWVGHELEKSGLAYARGRVFATGGSGGGNVALMANKLAPRTFACVIDMCGMKRLSDDVAFDRPGGSPLNARWSRDPAHPSFLSPGAQELREVGFPAHLELLKQWGNRAKVITVHGVEDTVCPFSEAAELETRMKAVGLDFVLERVTPERQDGKVFTSAGHALGDRSQIPGHVAGRWLRLGNPDSLERTGPSDFELREERRFPVQGGSYVVSYRNGYPVGRFESVP